ncbi:MAG: hypothetical protein A2Z13_04425 [Deltaproteobacteria bacterium RBG_16_64_85]|nr:MAG: hypothetical protein A2Z13_04425 [Deltaproteobacteria bacterium RBG_16_64_85]
MIDRELVTRKIVLIGGDLEELRKLAGPGLEAYLADPYKEILAERFLERMISRMIDINYHVITGSDRPPPRDYYDSFTELGKMGVLDPGFASRVASAAGLRNRIVHEYDDIEPDKVFEAIQSALADLPIYLQAVLSFIG